MSTPELKQRIRDCKTYADLYKFRRELTMEELKSLIHIMNGYRGYFEITMHDEAIYLQLKDELYDRNQMSGELSDSPQALGTTTEENK
jgi:hypothetical protein